MNNIVGVSKGKILWLFQVILFVFLVYRYGLCEEHDLRFRNLFVPLVTSNTLEGKSVDTDGGKKIMLVVKCSGSNVAIEAMKGEKEKVSLQLQKGQRDGEVEFFLDGVEYVVRCEEN